MGTLKISGMRVDVVLGLNADDIDFDNRHIFADNPEASTCQIFKKSSNSNLHPGRVIASVLSTTFCLIEIHVFS